MRKEHILHLIQMVFTVTIYKLESFKEGIKDPYEVRFISKSDVMYATLEIPEELIVSSTVTKNLEHSKGTHICLDITAACKAIGVVEGVFYRLSDRYNVFVSDELVLKLYLESGFNDMLPIREKTDSLGISPPLLDKGRLKGTPFFYTLCKNAGNTLNEREFISQKLSELLELAREHFEVDDETPENFTIDKDGRIWCVDPDYWAIL